MLIFDDSFGFIFLNGDGWIWCCLVGGVDGDSVIGIYFFCLGVVWFGLCKGLNLRDFFSVVL